MLSYSSISKQVCQELPNLYCVIAVSLNKAKHFPCVVCQPAIDLWSHSPNCFESFRLIYFFLVFVNSSVQFIWLPPIKFWPRARTKLQNPANNVARVLGKPQRGHTHTVCHKYNTGGSFLLVSGKVCPAATTIIVVMACLIIMLMMPMGLLCPRSGQVNLRLLTRPENYN